ncbi:hypothetical protein IWW36_002919 [Coemansia brasiliensis]|uniref:Bromo domain-containing protein n=1 Tax=Coemansia brasiliensis TaxID=2650707 RepID=A0A9W8IB36_9FUNG|nr:hypothetical protein IWW36_002919 [Coemansia brasiliensis]
MASAPLSQSDRGDCTTRDKLVVLSLVAEFGTENWEKITSIVAKNGISQRTYAYTQTECQRIYMDAVRDFASSVNKSPASALRQALLALKGQRMDEIRDTLQQVSKDIASAAQKKNTTSSMHGEPPILQTVANQEAKGKTEHEYTAMEAQSIKQAAHADVSDLISPVAKSEPESLALDSRSSSNASSPKNSEHADRASTGYASSHAAELDEITLGDKAADEQQLRNWKKNINMVWREISGHRYGSMFLGPIKSADAPHYYEVIRKPLDLKTIKNRIRDEEILTTVEFYRDIMHMLMNALMYNAEDTEVYHMAMEILPDAQVCIEQLLQTEAAVRQPKDGSSSAGGASGEVPLAAVKIEDEPKANDHEEDSDASVPTKRKRRVASERASKHLRE